MRTVQNTPWHIRQTNIVEKRWLEWPSCSPINLFTASIIRSFSNRSMDYGWWVKWVNWVETWPINYNTACVFNALHIITARRNYFSIFIVASLSFRLSVCLSVFVQNSYHGAVWSVFSLSVIPGAIAALLISLPGINSHCCAIIVRS